MNNFDIHSLETAPPESVDLLTAAQDSIGFLPNLLGVFAESPPTLNAYLTLGELLDRSSLSPTERQVAILAISRFNECDYCVAAHSTVAGLQNVPEEIVEAIRNDQPIRDTKFEALRCFATSVVEKRGWVGTREVDAFLAAGYSNANVLEVVLAASFKTLSNYVNHIAETPLDDAFSAKAWTPIEARKAS